MIYDYIPECPACGSNYASLLGSMGNLTHLRCRDCGATYSTDVEANNE